MRGSSRMSRQTEGIDLLKLYSLGSNNGWNQFLDECLANHDVNRLKKTMRGIQVGMDNATKLKLPDDKIANFYVRLLKSLENTMKAILRQKYPNPRDNPKFAHDPAMAEKKWLEIKRKRDQEFESFLRKSSF